MFSPSSSLQVHLGAYRPQVYPLMCCWRQCGAEGLGAILPAPIGWGNDLLFTEEESNCFGPLPVVPALCVLVCDQASPGIEYTSEGRRL